MLQIVTLILMGMVKYSESSQNSKFAMSLQYLKKEFKGEVNFLHVNKHFSYKVRSYLNACEILLFSMKTIFGRLYHPGKIVSLALVCFYHHSPKKCNLFHEFEQRRCLFVIQNWSKNLKNKWKQHKYLKISMQANWDEKYLTQVEHFSHVNMGWKAFYSD